jgi:hypothetical protein
VGTWGQEPLTLTSRSARRRLRSVQSLSKAAPTKKKRAKRPRTERLMGGAGSGWMTPSWVRSLETRGSSPPASVKVSAEVEEEGTRSDEVVSDERMLAGRGVGPLATAAAFGHGRRRRGKREGRR